MKVWKLLKKHALPPFGYVKLAIPKEVVIDRQTWLRGEGHPDSFLYRSGDDKKCCLGFAALAAGANVDDIKSMCNFETLHRDKRIVISNMMKSTSYGLAFLREATEVHQNLIDINDHPSMSEEDREKQIKEEFGKAGIEITFIN